VPRNGCARSRFGIATLFALLALALPALSSADPPESEGITFCQGLPSAAYVTSLIPGPDGNVWFVDSNAFAGTLGIGKVTPLCEIIVYQDGETLSGLNAGSDLVTITAGPKGEKYLWFTDRGTTPAIGRIDSASPTTAAEYSTGLNAGSKPAGIVAGPDGNLWFTDNGTTPAIGVINPSTGEIKEFSVGLSEGSAPRGIVTGPDGNLWFTDTNPTEKAIGRLNPSTGEIKEFATDMNSEPGGWRGNYGPWGIAPGADGNVWYTEGGTAEVGKAICRITSAGTITCFKTEIVATSQPRGLTAALNGKLWFTDSSGITEQQTIAFSGAAGGEEFELCNEVKSICGKFKYTNVSSSGTRTTMKNTIKAIYEAFFGPGTIGTISNPPTSCGGNCSFTVPFAEEGSLVATDVEQPSCSPGGKCSTGTTTNGVPNAVGCVTMSGEACETARYPIPGVYNASGITCSGDNVWFSGGIASLSYIARFDIGGECIGGDPTNLRTLTVTKSPAPNAGSGTGLVSSKPTGIKCGTACDEAVIRMYKESSVELTAKASTGSTFVEWTGACTGASPTCTIKMTEDKEVGAVFTGTSKAFSPAEALTVSKGQSEGNGGKGTVKAYGSLTCEADCWSTTILYQGPITEPKAMAGKTVILKQFPAFGSKFVGWTGCDSEPEGNCQVTMEADREVTAEYAALPNKTLTVNKAYAKGNGSVSSKPKGIKCATTCTQAVASMPEGAKVELVAKPTTGTFVKWVGGDCNESASPTCVVTMNADETTEAVFSDPGKAIAEAKTLTLEKAGSGYGTVKASGLTCEVLCTSTSVLYQGPITEPKAKPGKTVILKGAPAPGSRAVEWFGCDSIDEEGNCVVAIEGDRKVTATFDELE